MENLKKIELLAIDFKNTDFWSNDCAIGKAFKRLFPFVGDLITFHHCIKFTNENAEMVEVHFQIPYEWPDFDTDAEQAEQHSYDNTVISTIIFEPNNTKVS